MNKIIKSSILYLLALFICNCSNPVQNHYNNGNQLLAEEKYEEAIDEYSKAIELDSSFLEAFAKRSIAKQKTNDLLGYCEDHTRAGLTDTTNHEQILFRGRLYFSQKKYNKALIDFTTAIKLWPLDPRGKLERGLVYLAMKNGNLAKKDFSDLLKNSLGDSTVALFYRGKANVLLNNYENSINDFSIAIKLQPTNKTIYMSRASSFKKLKNYEKALLDIDTAVGINPDNHIELEYRGMLHMELKKHKKAKKDFEKCLEFNSRNTFVLECLGEIEFELKNYNASIDYYNKSLNIDSSVASNYFMISYCYQHLNDSNLRCNYLQIAAKKDSSYLKTFKKNCLKN